VPALVLEKLSSSHAELEARRSGGCKPPLPLIARFGNRAAAPPAGLDGAISLGPSSPLQGLQPPRGCRDREGLGVGSDSRF